MLSCYRETKDQIASECSLSREGSHNYLLNLVLEYIKKSNPNDGRTLRRDIFQLKKLRESADYEDENFDSSKSSNLLDLMREILPILRKY